MNKKKLKWISLTIIIAIVGIFVASIVYQKIKIGTYITREDGKLVKDYNIFFTLQDVIDVYDSYIRDLDYESIKTCSEKYEKEDYYKSMNTKIDFTILKTELKYAYKVDENTYKCEFDLYPNYEENSESDENTLNRLNTYKDGILKNNIVIKLDMKTKQFKILDSKYNI